MKKIVVFMIAAFLFCTIGSYSHETTAYSLYSATTELNGQKNVKARVKQKKKRSKKKIRKPKSFPRRKAKMEGHKIIR